MIPSPAASAVPGRTGEKSGLTAPQLLEMYRAMLLIRTLDERMMTLQRPKDFPDR